MDQQQQAAETAASSFGEKVFDASCRATIAPQAALVDAVAEIWTLGIVIKPSSENSLYVAFTEASKLEASNYRVGIIASSGLAVTLSQFGAKYDHFSQKLLESYGNALAKALLMEEPTLICEAPCFFVRQEQTQTTPSIAPAACRARIYETALIILPSSSSLPQRVPFSQIQSSDLQNYKVKLLLRSGGTIEFSKLANATQFFYEKLKEAMKTLETSSIETIRAMIPSATFEELHNLSWLMVEGRAAGRNDVEKISPGLWIKLEKNVDQSSLREAYHYLSSIGNPELNAVGLKKTKDTFYVWFMIPVMGSIRDGGNTVALEVTSESGHATYMFRVMSRAEFPSATTESFLRQAQTVIGDLNEALIATGFRREPIYLSSDQLNTRDYSKYLYAADHLEPLKFLRERFFARIIHTSFDSWKVDLNDALHFNTSAKQDSERWSKNALDLVETDQIPVEAVQPVPPVVETSPAVPVQLFAKVEQGLNAEMTPQRAMTERVFTLNRMDADERGNVKLCLHDNEFDEDVWVKIPGDEAMKLGAFPGSKVKITLEKN